MRSSNRAEQRAADIAPALADKNCHESRHDRIGRVCATGSRRAALERMMASHMNPLRADSGLPPVRTLTDVYLAAQLAFSAEPFEYPRSD